MWTMCWGIGTFSLYNERLIVKKEIGGSAAAIINKLPKFQVPNSGNWYYYHKKIKLPTSTYIIQI